MKQIVDFEQAKKLHEAKIETSTDRAVNCGNLYSHTAYIELPKDDGRYFAPTIGELIEWIMEHQNVANPWNQIHELDAMFEKYKLYNVKEFIDALVELAIKIKGE